MRMEKNRSREKEASTIAKNLPAKTELNEVFCASTTSTLPFLRSRPKSLYAKKMLTKVKINPMIDMR